MKTCMITIALLLCFNTFCQQPKPEPIVAAVLIAEAGGEGVESMQCVANVIQHRAKERHISSRAVVLQPKQFSCLNGVAESKLIETSKQHPLWQKALALSSGTVPDITGGATFFYAPKSMKDGPPKWAAHMRITRTIKNLVFLSP